jgi:acyl-CoA thioester hydrolase
LVPEGLVPGAAARPIARPVVARIRKAMSEAVPLNLYCARVLPEWIDYNGHMNVGFYSVAFDHATDAFYDYVGLDDRYREAAGGTTFTAETHITFQRELWLDDPIVYETWLLGFDVKRLHYFHRMIHAEAGHLAATCECLSLHVDLRARRVCPMPEDKQRRLAALFEEHRNLPTPTEVGRVMRIAPRGPA